MNKEVVIVFDCGATNARAVAVDSGGKIIASAGFPNSPSAQKGLPGCLVWDMDSLWEKLSLASRKVASLVRRDSVKAVTITTFGADGTSVDENGKLTYPVISWQCPRTNEIQVKLQIANCKLQKFQPRNLETTKPRNKYFNHGLTRINTDFTPEQIYGITGYQIISFNTVLKLMWLRKNAPQALKKAKYWMMMPGLLSHRLCSEFSIDPTIGSTMMAMDVRRRDWSDAMLGMAGTKRSFFPGWVQPGGTIGRITRKASAETGLPADIPVIACGHDTQFALHGCGARADEAVLSTGTWEILMVRAPKCDPDKKSFDGGLIYECDAVPGFWNPQILMMGSGVVEWVRRNFYGKDAASKEIYRLMISEGISSPPGANGVTVIPSFKPDTGPFRRYAVPGTVLGLSLATNRADIYRAAIEGLSFQLRSALDILLSAMNYQPPSAIRVVGGGSKNDFWNQMRADTCNLPVTVTGQKEATVLGASMFAFKGISGKSLEEIKKKYAYTSSEHTFYPSKNSGIYQDLFSRFFKLPSLLENSH